MVSAVFTEPVRCISTEHDFTFLASLYKYFFESPLVIGRPEALSQQFHKVVIEAMKRQVNLLADNRKSRAARANSIQAGSTITADWDWDDMALKIYNGPIAYYYSRTSSCHISMSPQRFEDSPPTSVDYEC